MSFFKSQIMRSYYQTAKKKGWVKEQESVKTASVKKSLKPSENLLVDMCKLADALRTKGYIKQADDLENKIAAFKTAETHLYKVHNEDGEDLLEFAHPDGDLKIEDAADGHGDVETLLSSHKKMIDVVNKQPTGKLAAVAAKILNKEAQEKKDLGALNISGLIDNLNFQLTMQMVMSALKQNSGPLYNFLNIYYHDFFKGMYSYYSDLHKVFGGNHPNIRDVVMQLNENPELYLNNISTVLNTGDLMGMAKRDGFTDMASWVLSKRGEIAQAIVDRFNQKYPGLQKAFDYINSDVNKKMDSFAAYITKSSNDPKSLAGMYQQYNSDGTLKYITAAVTAFHGLQYGLSLQKSLNASMDKVNEALSSEFQQKSEYQNTALPQAVNMLREAARLLTNAKDSDTAMQNSQIAAWLAAVVDASEFNADMAAKIKQVAKVDVSGPEDIAKLAKQWLDYAKSKGA